MPIDEIPPLTTKTLEDALEVFAHLYGGIVAAPSLRDVVGERFDQIVRHKKGIFIDDEHTNRSLATGALVTLEAYCNIPPGRGGRTPDWPGNWQVDSPWHKKMKWKSDRDKLVMAAALILAEIDRLDRKEQANATTG